MTKTQRGGLVLGLIIGVLLGLGLALAVALYVTKAPVPFVNKVPPRTADQDAAEAERNRDWDPNAGLAGRSSRPGDAPASAAAGPGAPMLPPPGARDPAAILSGGPVGPTTSSRPAAARPGAEPPAPAVMGPAPARSSKPGSEPFTYFVQAGAYQSSEEAEQQRARLAMLGVETKLIEREQSGRTVFRVRAGPFDKQAEADDLKGKLEGAGIEALLVRVERQP